MFCAGMVNRQCQKWMQEFSSRSAPP
jgi:hypothetical protein